jgi:streptogramin lyase
MLGISGMLVLLSMSFPGAGAPDIPFDQEYHEAFPVAEKAGANDVRAVAVDGQGGVWIAAAAGVYHLAAGKKEWVSLFSEEDAGPAFTVAADASGAIWAGTWKGLYRSEGERLVRIPEVDGPIYALALGAAPPAAFGPDGWWEQTGNGWARKPLPCARSVRAAVPDDSGGMWIATGMGLFHVTAAGTRVYQSNDAILGGDVHGLAFAPDGTLWAGGLGGVTQYRNGERKGDITTEQGLPNPFVQAVAWGPDGRMWIGTQYGLARHDGTGASVRHGRRWLLDDEVRSIAFDADGTAWIATGSGVSAIRRKPMTLEEKADYFMEICLRRHVREPWIVERVHLPKPGDDSQWEPEDDDNDGGYTAVYLVMEACRYAVTESPEARENARRAFELLLFLQEVTETPGFMARTVVPVSWNESPKPFQLHDRNQTYTEVELAARRVDDPRFKPVEVRWHPSSDGEWLWKGDTSSDEITAHFFGMLFYHDLVAGTDEKARVAALARRIMDYIIDHDYVLVDLDGKHTRWGVWAPERLNHDPDWRAERGINSAEILSYLKTTWHLTGDEKYQREFLRLLHEHGYGENVRRAKSFERSWRTHIDDELLAFAYPGLMLYEQDAELKTLFRESLDGWYEGVRHEQSPFFNFIYGLLTGADPQPGDSLLFLRDAPLDLINWTMDNSRREDIRLVRAPVFEVLSTSRLLPPSERGVVRWDKNPWAAVQGDGGRSAWAPTYWLLPYWLGRYAGFIAAPAK